jgi:hypothetical protein
VKQDEVPSQDLDDRSAGRAKREAGYKPPPTERDRNMSIAHHQDTLQTNLQHAEAHTLEARRGRGTPSEGYNLQHAQEHAAKALEHAVALKDRLSKSPKYRTHFRNLNRIGR